MFEYTEYELQKRRHKQELVRNEFKMSKGINSNHLCSDWYSYFFS